MSEGVVILMITVSTILGALGLLGLLWAVRNGQFDDSSKFKDATKFDNIEDLQDAAIQDEKKRQALEKKK